MIDDTPGWWRTMTRRPARRPRQGPLGREDRIVGAPDEAALPAGFKVAWIAGAGHMPHLEKSAEVNALLAGQVSGG